MQDLASLFKQRNPGYTYNTALAVMMWLNYLSKYTKDVRNVKAIRSVLENDITIIEDVFRDTEIIQRAFFGTQASITTTSIVNTDDMVVSHEILGSGAFGVVFAGKLNGKDVAVKTYTYIESRQATKRYCDWCTFMKEYAILCKLQDSGIVGKLYGACWYGGYWRMAMEPHAVRSIDWKRHPLCTVENMKQVILDIFAAIRRIHELTGYVHGDVKPCNIMLDIVADKPVVKIIDFGLSEPVGILVQNHKYVQSTYWRCPELLDEKPCDLVYADMWAATITAFDIMAGRCVMYELGATQDIDAAGMSTLLRSKYLNRTTIPDEWTKFIDSDLIEFANGIGGTLGS